MILERHVIGSYKCRRKSCYFVSSDHGKKRTDMANGGGTEHSGKKSPRVVTSDCPDYGPINEQRLLYFEAERACGKPMYRESLIDFWFVK